MSAGPAMREAWASGEVEARSAKFTVILKGFDNSRDAFLEAYTSVPPVYNNGIQDLILAKVGAPKRIAESYWTSEIEYATEDIVSSQVPENQSEEVDYGFDFEIGGGTAHITQSYSTVSSHAPSGMTAPDFKGAINVTKDSVDGADVPVRSLTFSLTRSYLSEKITNSFIMSIYNLCCCMNTQPFQNFAAGEVLFLGASGSDKGKGIVPINFKFVAIPNETFNVGSIVGITKKGHDLLWIRYAEEEDTAAKRIVKRPVAAYVERVLRTGDLNNLPLNPAAV